MGVIMDDQRIHSFCKRFWSFVLTGVLVVGIFFGFLAQTRINTPSFTTLMANHPLTARVDRLEKRVSVIERHFHTGQQ